MRYRIREGIVFETICGESMLLATYHARKYCPAIFSLNEPSVFIWKGLERGDSIEIISEKAAEEYGISLEDASEAIEGFAKILLENGYLIA